MEFRPVIIWGLALVTLTGCQSYYPNGYGHYGPYSQFPTGTYVAPNESGSAGKSFPTPVDGKKNSGAGQTDNADDGNSKYITPEGAPNNLGAPPQDDDNGIDNRKRPSGMRGAGSTSDLQMSDSFDESASSLASVDENRFVTPVEYREPDLNVADREPKKSRNKKSAPSPYKKDPEGYAWLRGVVTRDSKSGLWRLTYAREPQGDDPYRGILSLAPADSLEPAEAFDKLKNGDVILVEGNIDEGNFDRFRRPLYVVTYLEGPLKPKPE